MSGDRQARSSPRYRRRPSSDEQRLIAETMNNLDNMASLTNDRIEQILLGNISSVNETRTKQRRVNMTSVFELWKHKRDQQSELPKKHKLGPKLSEDELRKASSKLSSIARDHFGHNSKSPSAEFAHIAFEKTTQPSHSGMNPGIPFAK